MATITVTLPEGVTLSQGKQISFTAPCDSTGVTGIIINNVTYTLLKANGGSLETGAFINGALISVLIDLTNYKAYIQNNAEVNVQSDWNATEGDAFIANKPTSMTPSSHTHGNITNDGKIGSTADLPVFTTTAGAVATKTIADAKTLLGIVAGAQIEAGSYTGTGTYGSENPVTLTFAFAPKIVFIFGNSYNGRFTENILYSGKTTHQNTVSTENTTFSLSVDMTVSWSSNTVSYYTSQTNAGKQLNTGTLGYAYVAIG